MALPRYALFLVFDLVFIIKLAFPHSFLLSLLSVYLCRRLVPDAHVGASAVVEAYETGDDLLRLSECRELLPGIQTF